MQRELYFSCSLSLVSVIALAAPARAQSGPSPNFGASEAFRPVPATRGPSAARSRDDVAVSEEKAGTGARAAEEGLLLPFTQSPQIYSGHAVLKATAGYDSALEDFVARTSAEARVLRFLALRVDFDHGPGMGPGDRFGVGARAQIFRQSAHEIDGSIGLGYQPNDFREEGQIVAAILLGRSFGRLHLFGNLLFGSDPEGDDQAGEARFSTLYRVSQQFHIGLDSRFRFNASEDEKRADTQTTDWELQATPTTSFSVGPIVLLGQAGLSMIQTTGPFGTPRQRTSVETGVVAMAGAGGAF